MRKYSFSRQERMEKLLQQEICRILQEELHNPKIKFVTIIRVELSSNLRHAKVLISIYNKDEQEEVLKHLNGAQGYIRKILAKELNFRSTPTINFKLDDSIEFLLTDFSKG